MSLTGEQYQDFIQDLTKIKPTDFAPLSGPGSVPVPPMGFPPSMGGAFGGLPPPGGAPSTLAPGASLNASSPSTGGYSVAILAQAFGSSRSGSSLNRLA